MAYSRSRNRYVALLAIFAVLTVMYLATGASSTRNSAFYLKTVELMDARGHTTPHEAIKRWPNVADEQALLKKVDGSVNVEPKAPKQVPDPPEQTLKDRLREAEKIAKKSADEKYRALRDVEAEIQKEREARRRAAAEETVKLPPATGNPRDLGPGEKSIAGRTKMPAEKNDVRGNIPSAEGLTGISDYTSPLTPKPGETEEQKILRETYAAIISSSPIVIFSKSYCPFSKKAKRILLQTYTIVPEPKVVELDEHPLGQELQHLLERTTGRRTVPNILVDGKTIGGGDEVEMLWKSGELPARLRQMAGKQLKKVIENVPYEKVLVHQENR